MSGTDKPVAGKETLAFRSPEKRLSSHIKQTKPPIPGGFMAIDRCGFLLVTPKGSIAEDVNFLTQQMH
jgi:hypothetical protein